MKNKTFKIIVISLIALSSYGVVYGQENQLSNAQQTSRELLNMQRQRQVIQQEAQSIIRDIEFDNYLQDMRETNERHIQNNQYRGSIAPDFYTDAMKQGRLNSQRR